MTKHYIPCSILAIRYSLTSPERTISSIPNSMRSKDGIDLIEFGIDDIVRSGLVKEYLIAKLEQGM